MPKFNMEYGQNNQLKVLKKSVWIQINFQMPLECLQFCFYMQ